MKPDTDTMAKRYTSIIVIVVLLAVLIILRAIGFMTFGRRGWQTVANRFNADSVVVQPQRGSILSNEGRVLVSSTPEYQFVFKYQEFTRGRDNQKYRDEVVRRHIADYAEGLHRLIPEQSAAEFRSLIEGALSKGNTAAEAHAKSGYYTNLYTKGNRRLTYLRYEQVKAFLDSCNTEYTLYANLGVGNRANRRLLATQWRDSLDAITDGLHRIVPSFSALSFRDSISRAIEHPGKQMRLCSITVSERQMQQIRQLPVLARGRKAGFVTRQKAEPRGFTFDEVMVRKNAYGLLATRTLGMWDEQHSRARNGIELAYDSLLRGKPGFSHRRKVMDTFAEFIDQAPQNGCDIVTTLDVRIQDIANKALRDQMEEQNADLGTAIVMETATGDIKAIVNLTRQNGQFVIDNNIALNQGIETGSIFKTASILAALDDGEVTLADSVNTAPFARSFYGYSISDDAGKKYAWKTIPKILRYSSNVGTMLVVDEHYVKKGKAEAFLKKLNNMGIAADHHVIPGAAKSRLKTAEQLKNWKGEALWMAVGYGISVTPMNMVAFYNAIANGGKMMRPRLIKEIQRDGHTVQKIDSQVAVESIARPEAIADITQCLIGVVNSTDGTGTRAQSDRFIIAGKTGTAKVDEHGQYAGRWLNFCGFFPADKPEYTCGVFVFRKAGHTGTANGGGTMSAPVLREIAERVMAYQKTTRIEDLRDSLAIFVPDVKTGNVAAADEVLDGLRIKGDSLRGKNITTEEGKVPNVVGMGAKDALYALESCGIKGHLNGFGKVHRQAIAPGADRKKGMTVELYLK